MVVQGRAVLLFEEAERRIEMGPGDHILIPAFVRHRVDWTSEEEDTVWLALHFV
jgi:cupin 2 domain-containing protein